MLHFCLVILCVACLLVYLTDDDKIFVFYFHSKNLLTLKTVYVDDFFVFIPRRLFLDGGNGNWEFATKCH